MRCLPEARGELSEQLLGALAQDVHALEPIAPPSPADPLADEDLHLALYVAYELHYRMPPDVDPAWEWEPTLLAFRRELERCFESALRATVAPVPAPLDPAAMDLALRQVDAAAGGPSLAKHLERDGTLEQMLEFLVHRSAYQLKEADPHSWALPRLSDGPKAAMVEIQGDEYGGGDPARIHAQLFANSMQALGLDPSYGAYLEQIPGVTLATVNLMSLFGLHHRLLGAIVGHLALFEMFSSVPNRRYANALRRLGFDGAATDFFDEHVEADAVHEAIAAVDLAGGLAEQQPALAPDILWGAAALAELEARWATHMLEGWQSGVGTLRLPLADAAAFSAA